MSRGSYIRMEHSNDISNDNLKSQVKDFSLLLHLNDLWLTYVKNTKVNTLESSIRSKGL